MVRKTMLRTAQEAAKKEMEENKGNNAYLHIVEHMLWVMTL